MHCFDKSTYSVGRLCLAYEPIPYEDRKRFCLSTVNYSINQYLMKIMISAFAQHHSTDHVPQLCERHEWKTRANQNEWKANVCLFVCLRSRTDGVSKYRVKVELHVYWKDHRMFAQRSKHLKKTTKHHRVVSSVPTCQGNEIQENYESAYHSIMFCFCVFNQSNRNIWRGVYVTCW